MISKRIEQIKSIISSEENVKKYIPVQTTPYTPDPAKPPVIRKAEAVAALFDHIDTPHMPGSRLAGLGSYLFTPPPAYFTEEDIKTIRDYPKQCDDALMVALEEKIFCLVPYLAGHLCIDQSFILKHGVHGMIARLRDRLQDQSLTAEQRDFLTASLIEWEAALRYELRYSKFYADLAEDENDPVLKEEYRTISHNIEKVPAGPAETFVEALQSLWFMYRCVHADDSSGHTFGRMDQLLYPFYQKDIALGRITKEDAKEYFYDFWLKFCAGHSIVEAGGDVFELTGNNEDAQKGYSNGLFWTNGLATHIITKKHVDDGYPFEISGVDRFGKDATNEISWWVLDALNDLGTVSVKPVLKYSDAVNQDFVKACYRTIMSGKALPGIAFDYNMRDAMRAEPGAHYTEEDLMNISNIGCIELAVPGKSFTDAMNCFMNLPKILLIALNNGEYAGRLVGVKTEPAKSFQDVLNNYTKQLNYFIELYAKGQNDATPFFCKYYVRPLTSTLVEGCIEKAMLLDLGGSTYWTKTMSCCGIADVADSLMAVKQVVYDEGKLSLPELMDVCTKNYQNNELLRQYLINRVPKYGNDISAVDVLAKFVVDTFCDKVFTCRTFNGKIFRPALYSFYGSVVRCGEATMALPNGRKAGEIFSLNISPAHGAIHNGISAVLKSMTIFDHRKGVNACPVDVQLSPGTPIEIVDYIAKYLDKHNALLLQIGCVRHEDMVEAQKHPERYQDLLVRVSGFSARFVVLDKEVQDEIIQRSYWA